LLESVVQQPISGVHPTPLSGTIDVMDRTLLPNLPIYSADRLWRWLFLGAGLLILAGYLGPWVPHVVAGLVVTGLDLGEYVKFLPVVRSGEVILWRESFYLPLVVVSLAFSCTAFYPSFSQGWSARIVLLMVATVAALNLLPPAWSPAVLRTPEFRPQVLTLVVCLGAVAISPFLALLPRWLTATGLIVLSLAALWWPVRHFLRILPAISALYGQPLVPGWGFYLTTIGLLLMIAVQWFEFRRDFSLGSKGRANSS
jgi:hypothetical protein